METVCQIIDITDDDVLEVLAIDLIEAVEEIDGVEEEEQNMAMNVFLK